MFTAGQTKMRAMHNRFAVSNGCLSRSDQAGQDVPQLGAPQERSGPFRVYGQKRIHDRTAGSGQKPIGDDVGVDDDHLRPSRLRRSISSGVTVKPRVARNARASASSFAVSTFRAGETASSSKEMTSWFRLRLWLLARAFSRRCSGAGSAFSVRVGIMQPKWLRSSLRQGAPGRRTLRFLISRWLFTVRRPNQPEVNGAGSRKVKISSSSHQYSATPSRATRRRR